MFKERKPERESNQMVFGIRAVMEAINAGKELESLYVQKGLSGQIWGELRKLLTETNMPFQYVPVEKLNRLTPKNHQGVIAYISPIVYQKVEDLIPIIYEKGEVPLLLLLDRITDVRNFGAIVRSAACMGVQAVVIPARGAAQINPDAVKTSAGALHKIPICRETNLKSTLQFLSESGLQVVSCSEKASKHTFDIDFKVPTVIILGSEEDGISEEYMRFSNEQVKIPMNGNIASLNVSVSAGIILYEVIKQRMSI